VKQFGAYNIAVIAVALAALAVVGAVQPLFFSSGNIMNVSLQATPLMIFALAQMAPLLSRGLDLSQGGVVVATSVAYALFAKPLGTGQAILPALLVGAIAGVFNGLLIALFRISPFIVTLGTGSILQGFALMAANGQPISDVPANFSTLYYATVMGVPGPLLVAALVSIVLWFMFKKMLIGRRIAAVGSNDRAAFLSGIPVWSTLVAAYAIAGVTTSVGSILLSSRISSGHPTAGSDSALQAVAAAVIGGVSLFGGRGSVAGALTGAIFLAFVANALNLLNISSFLQYVAVGAIIILAVVTDRFRYVSKAANGRVS
jgi:ribose transport system permease protein